MKAKWQIKAVKAAIRRDGFLPLALLKNWPFGLGLVIESILLFTATERHVRIRLAGAVVITIATWVMYAWFDSRAYRRRRKFARLLRQARRRDRRAC